MFGKIFLSIGVLLLITTGIGIGTINKQLKDRAFDLALNTAYQILWILYIASGILAILDKVGGF